ncbi:hypothetical protein KC345_g889 [Hortaea werneckii]|nr:hypothetical protein KC345_g889 [Hortaea werneckii]
MAKPKQLTKPPKKPKAKAVEPETADDFQEAADLEEETGGKWRAGDPAKAGRAFVRALEVYDKGLQKHTQNFDLAYNKARLELEITQQPSLVAHIGLPLEDLLQQTLDSHRYALRLNEENPDVLFNTSQVLTSLAEALSENGDPETPVSLLEEALELLSACLSRQEMLLEQQQVANEGSEESGGVRVDGAEPNPSANSTTESDDAGQYATVESAVGANDLLDTANATLSALTILVSLVDPGSLQTFGNMAQAMTEKKAPTYIGLLPEDARDSARFTLALARANFVAAFADAQYNAFLIEANDYIERLQAFDIPAKDANATALGSEAEARTELATSVMARHEDSADLPHEVCWKQLSTSQELYAKATKLDNTPQLYLSRADVEMLRHRIASLTTVKISDAIRKSAPTLVQNAQTFYKGAVRLAAGNSEHAELKSKAQQRLFIASQMRKLLYGAEIPDDVAQLVNLKKAQGSMHEVLMELIGEGMLESGQAEELAMRIMTGS